VVAEPGERVAEVVAALAIGGGQEQLAATRGKGGDWLGEEAGVGGVEEVLEEIEAPWRGVTPALGFVGGDEGGHGRMVSL
jgi:hypothetical protein